MCKDKGKLWGALGAAERSGSRGWAAWMHKPCSRANNGSVVIVKRQFVGAWDRQDK